jgi:hypothetical protein
MRKAVCLATAVFLGLTTALPGVDEKKGKTLLAKAVARPSLAQLIEQLGDRRYRVREQAQRQIAEMDDGVALPVLIRARLAAKDSEVVRRLDALIPAMERNALLKAKIVSLHVNKRTLQEITAELTRQTGYGIDLDNVNSETFTLNFDNLPFWEALDRVCKAARVSVYTYNYYGGGNDRIRLNSYGAQASPFVSYAQAFRLVANNFHLQRYVNFAGPADAQPPQHSRSETLTLNLTVQSEPKIPITQVLAPEISEAFDENKRPMAIKAAPVTTHYYDNGMGYSRYGGGYRSFSMATAVNLLRPTRDSKFAKLIKGEIPVVLSQEVPEFVIEQPLTVKKKKFKRSITDLEIEDVTEGAWGNGKSYTVKLSVQEQTDMRYNDYNWLNTLPQHFELLDAKGNKYMCQNIGLNSMGPRLAKGQIQFYPNGPVALGPPVKLVYNKWIPVNHRIKFELHNLPMP